MNCDDDIFVTPIIDDVEDEPEPPKKKKENQERFK